MTKKEETWDNLKSKPMPDLDHTPRGFAMKEFTDRNGHECSVQKSSVATEDCIWLGANEIGLMKFAPGQGGQGWYNVNTEGNFNPGKPDHVSYVANNRMHLDQETVKKLIPVLQRFVDTGEL